MKIRIDVNHFLFLAAYISGMLEAVLLNLSAFGKLPNTHYISWMLRGSAVLFTALKLILNRKYELSSLLYAGCAGLLLMISSIRSDSVHVLYLAFVVLGMRGINPRIVIRTDFCVRLVLSFVIILSCLLGIIDDQITYRSAAEVRFSLGFVHPNTLASMVFILVMEDAWIRRRQFSILYMGAVLLIGITVYLITLSRTSVALMIIFPFLLIPVEKRTHKPTLKMVSICVEWGYLFFLVLSFVTMKLCKSSMLFGILNRLMSGRFSNCAILFEHYRIPLFGQKVPMGIVNLAGYDYAVYAPLDVSYLRAMLESGILVTALYGFLHMAAVRKACRTKDRYTLLILAVFLLYGFSESIYNNVYINFSLLFGACAAYEVFGVSRPSLRCRSKPVQ